MTQQRRSVGVIIGALMLAMLLAALDQTIVSTALPTIVRELGGLEHLSWVVTAYMLGSTVATPLWGKLGDQYGRKNLFLGAIVIFLAASALCGQAGTLGELIAFRALQGVGGGGLMALAAAIVGDVVPPRERGRYQGLFGAVFGVSSVAGPLLGGLFVDHLSWRWVFYVNLPLGVLALVAVAVALHSTEVKTQHKVDFLGIGLLAAAVSCLVLLTSWGGTTYAWGSVEIIGLGVAAVVLGIGWWLSARRAAEPVLPLHLFRMRIFALGSAISFVIGFAMFGALTFLPLFLQVVHGVSATMSGVYLLPMVGGMLLTSITSGQLISRTGNYRIYPVVGTVVTAGGLFLLSRMDEHTSAPVYSSYFFVLGAGLGLVMQVLVIAVQNSVGYRDLGVATSGVTFFRSIGGSFGVSVFGTIFSNRLKATLGDARPGTPEYLHAYSASLQTVFAIATPIALLAFVFALLLRDEPLRDGLTNADLGESLGGAPTQRTSLAEIEKALSQRADTELRHGYYRWLAAESGLGISPAGCWIVARLSQLGPTPGAELADLAGTTVEKGRPYTDDLVEAGLLRRADGTLELTLAGEQAAERLFALRRAGLERLLGDWSPDTEPDLDALLDRMSRALLGADADRGSVRAG
ncbi:MDR family MFS transporter [Longispora sp. K20-0274]|uniref:MFS transporter n=1 Tax=Longispora sp. K20-0274 TaxID=3088255 RepID=UPI00399B2EEF